MWNGVPYTVTAKKIAFYYTNIWSTDIGIGNPYCATKSAGKKCTKWRNDSETGTTATDTGEPFWIIVNYYWISILTKNAATATVAIYQE